MNNRIGLLLPKSVIYPTLSFDLMNGLRCGLADKGVTGTEIKTESIGIGSDNKLIYSACEKLLFDGCTVVAGYVNPTTAETLEPLFAGANAIFISLDSGYHYPSSTKALPHVFYLSLQGALCCGVVARTAISQGIKEFAMACSFYDAGYRSANAFHGALEANGGTFNFHHVTKLKRAEFTLAALKEYMSENKNAGVLASFCGDMMQDLYTASASENIFDGRAVFGSSFMGEEQWLAQCPYPGADIVTCVPWASELDNDANRRFKAALTANKQRANIFSELTWEAGQIIAGIINEDDTESAIKKMEGREYSSPRGHVTLDAATHQAYAPVYEAVVKKNEDTGNCKLVVVRESPYTEEQRKQLEQGINNLTGTVTSWQNAYACLDS